MLIASSCAAPRPDGLQPVPIWVVDDGNHNGIVVSAKDAPLKPSETAATLFVEYGFSDRRWMQERTLTLRRIWELIARKNEGVIVLRVHASLEAATLQRKNHRVLAHPAEFARLSDELWRWVRRDGLVEKHEGPTPTFVIASTHSYSLLNNCRVFTARLLQQLADPNKP
jgi:hypothetical protein